MKEITLTNYESVEKFIEAVENAETWDAIPVEDYEEALEQVYLSVEDFDDPDKMWDSFKRHCEVLKEVNKLLEELKEEESDGYSHSREFFDSLVGERLGKKWSDLYMSGKIDSLILSMIALNSVYSWKLN